MLSPDGHCKTLDAAADGYARSEAVLLLHLRNAAKAPAGDEPALALVLGSAVNQDGRSSALTAPSGPAQRQVIRSALTAAASPGWAVDALQLHGTGTPLGDPIEIGAAYSALVHPGSSVVPVDAARKPLLLGASKAAMVCIRI